MLLMPSIEPTKIEISDAFYHLKITKNTYILKIYTLCILFKKNFG